MKPVTRWISAAELAQVDRSEYWNDVAAEREKEWWIADGNYERCLDYLKTSGLLAQYVRAEAFVDEFVSRRGGDSIIVADLACGIGWTSAALSKLPYVGEVRSVELSEHRLLDLFEHAVKMLGGQGTKISRYLGSFYNLGFASHSVDLIFLSQAFHHADRPFHLLHECDRVLRPGGRIILMGEPFIKVRSILKAFITNILKKRKVTTNFFELFPPDPVPGDHYYRVSDYYFLFGSMGYAVKQHFVTEFICIYVADKAL